MSLLCRQERRRLACMAGLAMVALVLVACGQATSSTAEPVAVRIDPVTLEVGAAPYQISLSNKFSGSELTYTATSNNPAVATAKVDGATLTVTAVGAGKATITVTATDPQDRSARTSFTVTVDRPTAPDPDPDPVDFQDISALEEDATRRIPLGDKFSGEDLTYAAESSDESIATATVDNEADTLTVTAVGPGTAIITVTATAPGSAPQTKTFTVTVPTPTPPPTTTPTPTPQTDCTLSGSSLTITVRVIRETSKKCTVPDGHSLQHDGNEVLEHHIEGNTWSITAKLKGSHVVHLINDQDGTRPGSITVIVPNTAPTLKSSSAGKSIGTDASDEAEVLIGTTAPITNTINPGKHFDDADTGDIDTTVTPDQGRFRFRIFDKPAEVLIRTHRGFIAVRDGDTDTYNSRLTSAEFVTQAIILKNPNPLPNTGEIGTGRTYEIRVSAYDEDNDPSDSPVTLEFSTELPKEKTYTLKKSGTTSYKRPKIGNRIGVPHTVELSNTDEDDDVVNYNFLDFITVKKITDKIKIVDSSYTGPPTVAETICDDADADSEREVTGITDQGIGCWSRTISGSEASVGTFAPKASPSATDESKIPFTLGTDRRLNDPGDVTITLRYWVVARAADPDATPPEVLKIVEVGRRSLTLDIHSCVEFSDCP